MQLRRPTVFHPVTVTQSLREIVSEDRSGGVRHVQILVPLSPQVFGALYPDPRFVEIDPDGNPIKDANGDTIPARNLAKAAGYERNYKLGLLPPGTTITMRLLPEQTFWACCDIEYALLSCIIEYENA